jgi:hypothetical protein
MPAAVAAETETAGAGAGAGGAGAGAGAGGGGLVKNDIAIEFVPEARLDHFGNKPGSLGAKHAFFFKFPYVCPEPVWVNWSFLVSKGAEDMRFSYLRTVPMRHWVRKNGIFEPFMYKNEHFAKTGSGQT